ncbi:very-short-patch-repair endonuclease [Microbacterium trichothecenolyticum]|nr:very-short-patch-repair endonuclease [Microbacterium trichothecenolyticum]
MHPGATRQARIVHQAVEILRSLGGIARTRTLETHGISEHTRSRLVADGVLERVGRSWLAPPGTDPELCAAAEAGAVLTCITAARRLGLWQVAELMPHLAVPAGGRRRIARAHLHWAGPAVPRHPDTLIDPIENVLVLVAQCRPHEEALAIWESALRRGGVAKQALERLALPPAARRLCAEASAWSDSGLESPVIPRLRWLRLPIRQQIWIAGHRVDFLIGDRLVLQVDGGTHVGPQREEDIRHDAELALLGYHVIRVGRGQVVNRWHEVQDLIMRAVAQGLHRVA